MPHTDLPLDDAAVARLYDKAGAGQWGLPRDVFAEALRTSARRAFTGATPSRRDLDRYLSSLHVGDVALACACALGHEGAWENFVRELRPVLYRAADALEPHGSARELADSLYADLYGLKDGPDGARASLFRYFHGRSSLATWLRAVLAQRYVDLVRSRKRIEPLPDEDIVPADPAPTPDPDTARLRKAVHEALAAVVRRLPSKDLLRLRCYYAMQLTLAQIGRLTHEHEATVSRQLARTRRHLHDELSRELEESRGLDGAEVTRAFEVMREDPAGLDLATLLGAEAGRKIAVPDRSRYDGHE